MKEKWCPRCKLTLPTSSFRWKDKEKGRLQGYCIECNKAKNREHYQANKQVYKDKARVWELSKGGKSAYRHNLSPERYAEILSKFDGKCWSCKEKPATVIDHDHSCCSGWKTCGDCVRGALCGGCNTGIGFLGDNLKGLQNAVAYLTDFRENRKMG